MTHYDSVVVGAGHNGLTCKVMTPVDYEAGLASSVRGPAHTVSGCHGPQSLERPVPRRAPPYYGLPPAPPNSVSGTVSGNRCRTARHAATVTRVS